MVGFEKSTLHTPLFCVRMDSIDSARLQIRPGLFCPGLGTNYTAIIVVCLRLNMSGRYGEWVAAEAAAAAAAAAQQH